MLSLLAQAPEAAFSAPSIDWHAIAPELVLVGVACLVVLIDSVLLERARAIIPGIVGLGFVGALIPVITLAVSDSGPRSTFSGAFSVTGSSLAFKGVFLVSAYLVVLLSMNYMSTGKYWEAEYYEMLIMSVIGMCALASATDLITMFVALELLSIPAYTMATWRKGDLKSNEAGLKYYLMGVFASAVLLYGMSFLYGVSGSTNLAVIGDALKNGDKPTAIVVLGVIFTLVGFAFKVSAVPFHSWAPDTYEGAPTPVTAFLAVASKAAGFAALTQLVFVAFEGRSDIVVPFIFVLSALSMTVGNLIALRQTNVVRMLAYSGIAQAGFVLAPFVAYHDNREAAMHAITTYLVIYAAMNLGAFAVVIAAARRTGSAERSSFNGLFRYSPGLALAFTAFLTSLIGFPPFGGWYAKFSVTAALVGAHTGWAYALAIVLAVNTAVAAFYYLQVARAMWFEEPEDASAEPISVPFSLKAAIGIALIATLVFGFSGRVADTLSSGGADTVAATSTDGG